MRVYQRGNTKTFTCKGQLVDLPRDKSYNKITRRTGDLIYRLWYPSEQSRRIVLNTYRQLRDHIRDHM